MRGEAEPQPSDWTTGRAAAEVSIVHYLRDNPTDPINQTQFENSAGQTVVR